MMLIHHLIITTNSRNHFARKFSFNIRSVNEVICHGIPDSRPLENGDIVNLDITVFKDGFHVDLN
jgi:methionine aminopeptidase